MSKIFSKYMSVAKTVGHGEVSDITELPTSWLMEEDIEIVGYNLSAFCASQSQNDGQTRCHVALSQDGGFANTGFIAFGGGLENWNTTPAFGFQDNINKEAFYPAGDRIQVREEGHIYLGMFVECADKTAGTTRWEARAVIFYTKKSNQKGNR
ncbi:hypothetical protein ES708_34987 [subsurface metagenome]